MVNEKRKAVKRNKLGWRSIFIKKKVKIRNKLDWRSIFIRKSKNNAKVATCN